MPPISWLTRTEKGVEVDAVIVAYTCQTGDGGVAKVVELLRWVSMCWYDV